MRAFLLAVVVVFATACSKGSDSGSKTMLGGTSYTVAESEIGALIDHPGAREIIDTHLPGFTSDEQIEVARPLTLPEVQPYYADLITDEALAKVDADLAELPGTKPVEVFTSAETEIGRMLDDPEARAIIDKHIEGFSTADRAHLTRPFTLKFIQKYAPEMITEQALVDIDADLAKLAKQRAGAQDEPMAGGPGDKDNATE
ncbi:hypothetical protein [uncultured Abyssibacter sp.]|uniref:hypothetical protein n=1 Tax=uncultured Abyssibacter sp. TaxID=2320202 RepID=UPI0032B27C78